MGGDQQQFLMGRLLEEALIHFVRQSEGKEPPDRDEEEGEGQVGQDAVGGEQVQVGRLQNGCGWANGCK